MPPTAATVLATQRIKQRQYAAYMVILLLASILAVGGYRIFNSTKILYRKAENLFNSGAFSAAIPLYKKVLDAGLKNENASHRLFQAYLAQGRTREAAALFEDLSDSLKYPEAILALAASYGSEGRWDDAIAVFRRYESVWIQSPAFMMHLADLYRNNANFDLAERWYRRALEQSPASLYARFRLAETLAWTRHYEEAIALFRAILTDHPEHRQTRLSLARLLGWSGRLEEAIVEYQTLLGDPM